MCVCRQCSDLLRIPLWPHVMDANCSLEKIANEQKGNKENWNMMMQVENLRSCKNVVCLVVIWFMCIENTVAKNLFPKAPRAYFHSGWDWVIVVTGGDACGLGQVFPIEYDGATLVGCEKFEGQNWWGVCSPMWLTGRKCGIALEEKIFIMERYADAEWLY